MPSEEEMDLAVMTTVVTAMLIKAGGTMTFSSKEWTEAILHDGSVFLSRIDEDNPMTVYLMRRPVQA